MRAFGFASFEAPKLASDLCGEGWISRGAIGVGIFRFQDRYWCAVCCVYELTKKMDLLLVRSSL